MAEEVVVKPGIRDEIVFYFQSKRCAVGRGVELRAGIRRTTPAREAESCELVARTG